LLLIFGQNDKTWTKFGQKLFLVENQKKTEKKTVLVKNDTD